MVVVVGAVVVVVVGGVVVVVVVVGAVKTVLALQSDAPWELRVRTRTNTCSSVLVGSRSRLARETDRRLPTEVIQLWPLTIPYEISYAKMLAVPDEAGAVQV